MDDCTVSFTYSLQYLGQIMAYKQAEIIYLGVINRGKHGGVFNKYTD